MQELGQTGFHNRLQLFLLPLYRHPSFSRPFFIISSLAALVPPQWQPHQLFSLAIFPLAALAGLCVTLGSFTVFGFFLALSSLGGFSALASSHSQRSVSSFEDL